MNPEAVKTPNVHAIRNYGPEPEDILRRALCEVAEMRARGEKPACVIAFLKEGCPPGLLTSTMTYNDLAACAQMFQTKAQLTFQELWEPVDE